MQENHKIVVHRLGQSFRDCTRIESEPLCSPTADEVVIQIQFAGVNGVYDQMLCADKIQHRPLTLPADTGVEAIGVVIEVGTSVKRFKVGDAAVTVGTAGGYRTFAICAESAAIPVPAASPEILALIPSGVSAMLALERVGEMTTDETVFVTAAAGGLGNIATQLAVKSGNHVIAMCGDDNKVEHLLRMGADRVVQYRKESLADVLHKEYREALNLAMDSVGGEVFDVLLENMAPHGRLVSCGATVDRLPPKRVLQERVYTKLYWRAVSVRGFNNFLFAQYASDARARLLGMLERGEIKPLIDKTPFIGLQSVADAGEHLLAGANIGKVIVDLRQK